MANSHYDPNRSLEPAAGQTQPFYWADDPIGNSLRVLRDRITQVNAEPLVDTSLQSLRYWFRTQHVFESNAIEGSTLTVYETKVVIEDGLTVGGKPLRDVLAANDLAHALDWVEELSVGTAPLSTSMIKQLHGLVVRGDPSALPGEFKRSENTVTGAVHRPPLSVHCPVLVDCVAAYLAATSTPQVDPIIESAVVHAWLVGIHPFQDGNGRTTRLISNLVLRRRQSLFALVQNSQRARYYETLDRAHCTGDLTDFILFWTSCVEVVVSEYERLRGDPAVRERAVEYAISRAATAREPDPRLATEYREAIDLLVRSLREIGARLRVTDPEAALSAEPMPFDQLSSRGLEQEVIMIRGQLKGTAFVSIVSLRTISKASERSFALRVLSPPPYIALDEVLRSGGKFSHFPPGVDSLTATDVAAGWLRRIAEHIFPTSP